MLFRTSLIVGAVTLAFLSFHASAAGDTKKDAAKSELPSVPPPSASSAFVADGYRVMVLLKNLTYPTSVEFDNAGNFYVAEAGYSYGDPKAKPRVMQRRLGGAFEAILSDELHGPVTDLLWHNGRLYISHRGKISAWQPGGRLVDLVTGLPSWGDHHNNQMAVGPDGKIYFGQGTATNSAVVGKDNYKMGWLKKYPDFHDQPAHDVVLKGSEFKSPNPLTEEDDTVLTAPLHPFTKQAKDGDVVPGTTKANGTILRMNPDGSGLDVFAWGLRNPYGVAWGPDGKLYASENGFDVRGSRPIANDRDDLYLIRQGGWYGWPDYGSGIPVTDPRFRPKDGPAPQFVMKQHPPVEKPVLTFPKHSAIAQLDFCRSESFGFDGQLFAAFFGHMTPMTGTPPDEHGGHQVARIDLKTGKVEKFFGHKEHHHKESKKTTYAKEVKETEENKQAKSQSHKGHGAHHKEGGATAGPRRLVDVRFAPDGQSLLVVDFGALFVTKDGVHPVPGTGVVWQITRDDAVVITP